MDNKCPKCGCNIMYYNMEQRLDADAEKAEAEWAKVDALLYKLTPKRFRKRKEIQNEEGETSHEKDA